MMKTISLLAMLSTTTTVQGYLRAGEKFDPKTINKKHVVGTPGQSGSVMTDLPRLIEAADPKFAEEAMKVCGKWRDHETCLYDVLMMEDLGMAETEYD